VTKHKYQTDLTDAQWKLIKPLLPREVRGRPRRIPTRRILNALWFVLATGVQWRQLPREFPQWQLVYYHFGRWARLGYWKRVYHVLRALWRQNKGRHKHATAGCQDSQSVKSPQGPGVRGYDANKKIKGRKRHLLVDTQGLPLEVVVTPAQVSDSAGAHRLWERLGRRRGITKKLKKVWVDAGYKKGIQETCWSRYGVTMEVVSKPPEQKGFAVQPRRWVIERSFGWISAQRRLVRDYEVLPLHSENMIWITFLKLVLRRLT